MSDIGGRIDLDWYGVIQATHRLMQSIIAERSTKSGDSLLGILDERIFCRSCLLPWYSSAGTEGAHFLNSASQLVRVDRGAMTRKGPCMDFFQRWEMKPTVWICTFPNWLSAGSMHVVD